MKMKKGTKFRKFLHKFNKKFDEFLIYFHDEDNKIFIYMITPFIIALILFIVLFIKNM